MTKQAFINELDAHLKVLPDEERIRSIEYYSEMIDEAMADGKTEEEAVALAGTPETVAAQIIADAKIRSGEVTEPITVASAPKKSVNGWEIACIVLLFPFWFPLLITAAAIVFAFFCTVWSIIFAFWCVFAAMAITTLAVLCASIPFFLFRSGIAGLFLVGAALLCAAIAILFFLLSYWLSRGVAFLTAWSFRKIFFRK